MTHHAPARAVTTETCVVVVTVILMSAFAVFGLLGLQSMRTSLASSLGDGTMAMLSATSS
jgi:hypothetical protein